MVFVSTNQVSSDPLSIPYSNKYFHDEREEAYQNVFYDTATWKMYHRIVKSRTKAMINFDPVKVNSASGTHSIVFEKEIENVSFRFEPCDTEAEGDDFLQFAIDI